MRKLKYSWFFTTSLLIVLLLTGCFGGGGTTSPKTYSLTVTVTNQSTNEPIADAEVAVVGKGSDSKVTNAQGIVSFTGLTGKVEVMVNKAGYVNYTQEVTMNKEQNITAKLAPDNNSAPILNQTELEEALADPEITSIYLVGDLATDLTIERPVNLNLNGRTLTGNLIYNFEEEENLELSGIGQLDGDLIINAPLATISNRIKVNGEIQINELAEDTWNEYYHNNKLVIDAEGITINIFNGAQSITLTYKASDSKINIIGGSVAHFQTDASVTVTGADKIIVAVVNAPHVRFDRNPGTVSGAVPPEIIQSFTPGEGGAIPAFNETETPSNTFVGLYLERTHRYPYAFSSGDYSEITFYFPSPESLGGVSYDLEYWNEETTNWELFVVAEKEFKTTHSDQDNFSFDPWGHYKFRLKMFGGPLDGFTSNEVDAPITSIKTRFSGWGGNLRSHTSLFVGDRLHANASAKTLSEESIPVEHLLYQWYRVDPNTYEMTKIPGATSGNYICQEADIGHLLLFRATGDGIKVGGFIQVFGKTPVLIANKAFISDVSNSGFTLNLHKTVPSLSAEELVLEYFSYSGLGDIIDITSVTAIEGSRSKFKIDANIPSDADRIQLQSKAAHWGIVGNYLDENAPYIKDFIYYEF